MEYVSTMIITFILIYIIYLFYYVMFAKRGKKVPMEATYLIKLYNLDINKFNYRKFLNHISLTTSFDIALSVTIVSYFDNVLWQILFALVTVLPIVVISFMLLGKYYSNKQLKDNSKELEKENNRLVQIDKFKDKLLKIKNIFIRKKGNDNND